MAARWRIGDRIEGRWEIYDIKRGGIDVVYIVYDHEYQEPFAIKTFLGQPHPRTVERFTQEALLWVNLDWHPNVTTARFIKNIGGKPCLFLEYVSGGHLGRWIRHGRLVDNLPQILRFAIHLCDGMMHAFAKGLEAHRDIKPENCLISAENTLKITDFGMARVAAVQEEAGIRGGTLEFAPPEQWENFELADERSDIYSFGATFYTMLARELPFGTTPEVNAKELARRQREDAPPRLPPEFEIFDDFVARCMAKDPAQRFASFSEVREQLATFFQEQTGEPAPTSIAGEEMDAMMWNEKGSSLRALGYHAQAVGCYERALEIQPTRADAWSNKGEALWALGDAAQALDCFKRALKSDSKNAEIWTNQAAVLTQTGQASAALKSCERAIKLNPRLAMAWNNKGVALMALGLIEESLPCYDRALDINPALEQAWMNKGSALGALGRTEQELAHYERALELNARLEQAWCNKGSVLAQQQRWDEAIKCYERALKLNAQHIDSWFNKAMALQELGQLRKASNCYDRALALNPADAEAWCHKAIVLAQLGRASKAQEAFEQAMEADAALAQAFRAQHDELASLS